MTVGHETRWSPWSIDIMGKSINICVIYKIFKMVDTLDPQKNENTETLTSKDIKNAINGITPLQEKVLKEIHPDILNLMKEFQQKSIETLDNVEICFPEDTETIEFEKMIFSMTNDPEKLEAPTSEADTSLLISRPGSKLNYEIDNCFPDEITNSQQKAVFHLLQEGDLFHIGAESQYDLSDDIIIGNEVFDVIDELLKDHPDVEKIVFMAEQGMNVGFNVHIKENEEIKRYYVDLIRNLMNGQTLQAPLIKEYKQSLRVFLKQHSRQREKANN